VGDAAAAASEEWEAERKKGAQDVADCRHLSKKGIVLVVVVVGDIDRAIDEGVEDVENSKDSDGDQAACLRSS
jgi:hypothetical protein